MGRVQVLCASSGACLQVVALPDEARVSGVWADSERLLLLDHKIHSVRVLSTSWGREEGGGRGDGGGDGAAASSEAASDPPPAPAAMPLDSLEARWGVCAGPMDAALAALEVS